MRNALRALALALVLSFASAAHVFAATYTVDPNHSSVGFTVRHFFSKVPGSFKKFSGTIVYDPAKPAEASVKAEIDPASIYTNNEKRDGHLRSEDFFFVEKHPTLTFESTKVTPAGENKLKVDGNLTMRGVTKPVTLDVTYLGSGSAGNGVKAGFEAITKVNRKDFGINWNRTLDQGGAMLSDDVEIRLDIEADEKTEAKAEAPAAKK
ncbi:MAG TPA: YceI family protein [Candidatus Eisenbacteria bacterium]|nr:YceI family protein [Candidatus Eisenbacteria bacterium]